MRTILTWLALVVCVCMVALPTMAAAVPAIATGHGIATVQQADSCDTEVKVRPALFKPCAKKVNGVATLCHPLPVLMPELPTLDVATCDSQTAWGATLPPRQDIGTPMFRPPRG